MGDLEIIDLNMFDLPESAITSEHPVSAIDPQSLDLPSGHWTFHQASEKSLFISEMIVPAGPEAPRVRKHVHVNLSTGICTSYVLDRKISEMPAITKIDVEHCVEELHMMHVCVGGPRASKFQETIRPNARVDLTGNWRHNSCKIVTEWTGVPCNACESLQYELSRLPNTSKQQTKSAKGSTPKRVMITNLSHRKQSHIIALRKRRQNWNRKKGKAEKEMKRIADMISEISQEPEENVAMEDDDDDEEDDDDDE